MRRDRPSHPGAVWMGWGIVSSGVKLIGDGIRKIGMRYVNT
jgi:hypothetical protein